MATFRIHLLDGSKHDIDADSAEQARKIAAARELGHVIKIKIVREAA